MSTQHLDNSIKSQPRSYCWSEDRTQRSGTLFTCYTCDRLPLTNSRNRLISVNLSIRHRPRHGVLERSSHLIAKMIDYSFDFHPHHNPHSFYSSLVQL